MNRMSREKLKENGLTDEQIEEVMKLHGKALEANNNQANEVANTQQVTSSLSEAALQELQEKASKFDALGSGDKTVEQRLAEMQSMLNINAAKEGVLKVLAGAKMNESEIDAVIPMLVSEDAEKSKKNAENYVSILNSKIENALKEKQKELAGNMQPPPAGEGTQTNTTTQEMYNEAQKNKDGIGMIFAELSKSEGK